MKQNIQFNRATEQIHIAAQYLAMMGKYYVPAKKDDSHTNLDWDPVTQQFASHPSGDQSISMFLRPSDLRLGIGRNPADLLAHLSLHGLTQQEGMDWVKTQLSKLDFDASVYQMLLHYGLPPYGDLGQGGFEMEEPGSFKRFSDLRGWAKKIIVHYKDTFATAQDDRTWPHHFDHGCYVPLTTDIDGHPSASLSFGLAIHDALQSSHYLYVTHWSSKKLPDALPPTLSAGRWALAEMHGALLPVSMLLDKESAEQTEKAHRFMREAIKASLVFLQLPPKEF